MCPCPPNPHLQALLGTAIHHHVPMKARRVVREYCQRRPPYDWDFRTGSSGTLTSSKSSCPTAVSVHQSVSQVSHGPIRPEVEVSVQTPLTTQKRPRPVSAFFMR